MQRTTEWRAPKPLVLSIDVLSNREAPVESTEKDAQTRRLGLVLEVRYLDDSLIPNDPDDSIAVAFDQQQQQLQLQQPPEPVKVIPWGSPGTDAHVSQSQFDPFLPPYLQQEQQHRHNSQQYNSEQYRGYRNPAADEDSPAVAGLPRSLQLLGPQLLQRIVQDPALLQSLLNNDGTVNEQKVFQLQESVDMQYPSSQRSQSRFGPYADERFGAPSTDYPVRGGMTDRYGDGGGSFPRRDQPQGSRATRFGEKTNLPFFPEGPPGAGGAMDPTGNRRGRNTRWGDMAASGGDLRSLQQPQAPQYPREGFDDGRQFDQPYPPRHGGREGGMGDDQSSYGHMRGARFADDDAIMENRAGDWDNSNREPLPYGDRVPSMDGGSFHPDDGYNKADGPGFGQPPQRKKVGASKQSRFPSAKAAVPCRFFNTRKGCQFGDKCEFGHFSAGAVPTLPGPPQVRVGSLLHLLMIFL